MAIGLPAAPGKEKCSYRLAAQINDRPNTPRTWRPARDPGIDMGVAQISARGSRSAASCAAIQTVPKAAGNPSACRRVAVLSSARRPRRTLRGSRASPAAKQRGQQSSQRYGCVAVDVDADVNPGDADCRTCLGHRASRATVPGLARRCSATRQYSAQLSTPAGQRLNGASDSVTNAPASGPQVSIFAEAIIEIRAGCRAWSVSSRPGAACASCESCAGRR